MVVAGVGGGCQQCGGCSGVQTLPVAGLITMNFPFFFFLSFLVD